MATTNERKVSYLRRNDEKSLREVLDPYMSEELKQKYPLKEQV